MVRVGDSGGLRVVGIVRGSGGRDKARGEMLRVVGKVRDGG